jgi:hypothetical protein
MAYGGGGQPIYFVQRGAASFIEIQSRRAGARARIAVANLLLR